MHVRRHFLNQTSERESRFIRQDEFDWILFRQNSNEPFQYHTSIALHMRALVSVNRRLKIRYLIKRMCLLM